MKQNKSEQYNLPKVIHFIWAGGSKKLPKDSRKVVKAWCQQNPGFSVRLWVDSQTASELNQPMDFELLEQEYVEEFKKIGVDVIPESELSSYEGQQAPVVIQDIGELRQGAVAFEIEQLRPKLRCVE